MLAKKTKTTCEVTASIISGEFVHGTNSTNSDTLSQLSSMVTLDMYHYRTGGCLFTQSYVDNAIGLWDERSLIAEDNGQLALAKGREQCVLLDG